jgi:lipopolysaccharide transport system ATP-binding protein
LEVGTGFHPELTGRENIYMNGTILGMRKREIDRKFDEIVDFSGVEKFLDTPIKRYSSGMQVRLAFAVAAHLEPEILIVDEVLAVGDAEFQKKCLGKMQDVAKGGRTVLFVSHNMGAVARLCPNSLRLAQGRLVEYAATDDIIAKHIGFAEPLLGTNDPTARPGRGDCRFVNVRAKKLIFDPQEPKTIEFEVHQYRKGVSRVSLSAHLVTPDGIEIAQCDSRPLGIVIEEHALPACGEFSFNTPWLKGGSYRVDLHLCSGGILDHYEGACIIRVAPTLPYPEMAPEHATRRGVVLGDYNWTVRSQGDMAQAVTFSNS